MTSLRGINTGVSQGTNLSTTIKDISVDEENFLYVDKIIVSETTIEDLERRMKNDIKNILISRTTSTNQNIPSLILKPQIQTSHTDMKRWRE